MLLPHVDPSCSGLRVATAQAPLRVLFSGCLAGQGCGVDGTDNGLGDCLRELMQLPTVRVLPFCPEDFALGTPRTLPDIHGGDGGDVLDGRARVLDQYGADLTAAMQRGAAAMLEYAQRHGAELAVLTDMSAACGSQVISDGCRLVGTRRYRRGTGVAAALLLRHGIPVVSQRDHRTLGMLRARLDPTFAVEAGALDHHQTAWFVEHFGERS